MYEIDESSFQKKYLTYLDMRESKYSSSFFLK